MREQLAIEIDGSIHNDPARVDYDAERQTFLEDSGITVLQFTNEQVRDDLPGVLDTIVEHVDR